MCYDLGENTHDWSLVAWCSPRVLGSYWKDASPVNVTVYWYQLMCCPNDFVLMQNKIGVNYNDYIPGEVCCLSALTLNCLKIEFIVKMLDILPLCLCKQSHEYEI